MAKLAKFLQGVAGAGGGAGLNVEDVFSTYLLPNGTSSTQTFVNGIDLANEGGMVWLKSRTSAIIPNHYISDSERVITQSLNSNNTLGQGSVGSSLIKAFNSDGFDAYTFDEPYVTWTFRKAPKFFDVITYSGNGSNQTISHNLGSTPGMIVVKARNNSDDAWYVWHRSLPQFGTQAQYRSVVFLDSTSAYSNYSIQTAQPDNSNIYVGSDWSVSGYDYVMYVFAHNDGDGEFGPDGDADIIKCGSFTTDSSGDASVDIGFEPQWIIYKRSDGTSNWGMNDNMRGWADTYWNPLYADASNAESGFASTRSWPTATGFEFEGQLSASANYIYIAIRRGPMAAPESATDVFYVDTVAASSSSSTGFDPDMWIRGSRDGSGGTNSQLNMARLIDGKYLATTQTSAEIGTNAPFGDGPSDQFTNTVQGGNGVNWFWKRAPNYFDVVAEPIASAQMSGPAAYSYNPPHNLGVTPEMIWVKDRDNSDDWYVYHSALGTSQKLILNSTAAASSSSWAVASDNFNFYAFGNSTGNAICYLFASLDGVSKVGSVSHTSGTPTNVDCGFSAGARFIILKRYDAVSDWWVFDTERGIAVGNDARLILNTTAAETSTDQIDPYSAGFTIDSARATGDYIFYAIA